MKQLYLATLATMALCVNAIAAPVSPPGASTLSGSSLASLPGLSAYEPFDAILPDPGKAESPAARMIDALKFSTPFSGDITGKRVMTFQTLGASLAPSSGLGTTVITATDQSGIYTISNFWDHGLDVKASIDLAARTVSIPCQQIAEVEGIGPVDIAVCTATGAADRENPVIGTILDDGTIAIDTWWGVYVREGQYAGKALGWYHTTRLFIPNATMRETRRDGTAPSPQEYSVVATQKGNVLSVVNFANHGFTVELVLTDTKRAIIEQQLAAMDVQYGNIYTSAIADGPDGSVTLTPTIRTKTATDRRTVSWTDWALRSATSYFGYLATGSITTDFDLEYPAMTTELEGDGTASAPYLLQSVADLNYLGRQAEADATTGRYYAITADIEMGGNRFQPIGSADHPFSGIIDGRGHTLRNLLVERSSEGYAALFGYASAGSEIRNICLQTPHITSKGCYNAPLAAWSEGLISGCEVMQPSVGSDYAFTAGLAAHANNVESCHVFLGNIAGLSGMTAGMVSELTGDMTGCGVADCIIYSTSSASHSRSGGLVASAGDGSLISDCYFSGVVSGRPNTSRAQTIGGLVGFARNVKIQRCFALATLENYTSDAITGGLAGSFSGIVKDCFTAGRVSSGASQYTGGLVGLIETDINSSVTDSYTLAETIAGSSSNDNAATCRELIGFYIPTSTTIANVYFDNNMCRLGNNEHGLSTASMTSASGPEGFSADTWTFTEGVYPRISTMLGAAAQAQAATAIRFVGTDHLKRITADTHVSTLGQTSLMFLVNGQLSTTGRGAEIDGKTIRLNGRFATDTLVIRYNPTDFYYHVVKFAPRQFEGEGTAESPYLIKTAADMDRLAEITSREGQPYTDTYFRLANDIDMAGDTTFLGIGCVPYTTSVTFNGHFDGAGHSILNLHLGKVVWTTRPPSDTSWAGGQYEVTKQESFKALFGTLGPRAVVKDLTVGPSCVFEGGSYVSAFSISNSGSIINCRNYAEVRALGNYAAGFACTNTGTITRCLNAGRIHANSSHAAGLACTNFGSLARVANIGEIIAKPIATVYRATTPASMYAGGIVSYNNGRTISDALNAGPVHCPNVAGGIVAYNPTYGSGAGYNQLIRCLNYGIVTAESANIGSIAGQGATTGTVENVYWDNQILPILPNASSAHTGMVATTTSALVSGVLPDGFGDDAWSAVKGRYPVLKDFAGNGRMIQAAQAVITLADGDNVRNITAPATLAAAEGLTWSLRDGTAFSIKDGRLNLPAEVTTAVNDVLTASCGTYSKSISISCIPSLSLPGAGTEADPYRITSADDWNTLADYVANNKADMVGQYVRLMNDIDFTGREFKPVSGSQWCASLLGDNHKLTGINHTFTAGKMGAIGILGPTGRISDLTIEGTFTQTKSTYAAAFVGEMYGQAMNCVNRAHVTGNKSYRAGIAAIAYEGAAFTDCANYGTIDATSTSAGNAAGICAETKGSATFLRCRNYGKTSGGTYCAGIVAKSLPSTYIDCANLGDQDNDVSFWGGIIGSADGNASITRPYIIKGCYNSATLRAKGNVAGIIASAGSSNNSMQISDCYNTGHIVSQGTVGTAVGLFGRIGRSSHVDNCWNSGKVEVLQSKSYAGGIIKETGNGTAEARTVIENCRNTGEIAAAASLAGGIACQSGSYITFRNCRNEGNVTAGAYAAGGILANSIGTKVEIEDCINNGTITAGTSKCGGIAGTTQTNITTISRCVNTGTVQSMSTTAGTTDKECYGIGGIAGNTGAEIHDCYNVGTIRGVNQVGGIVGQTYARSGGNFGVISLTRCYNMGRIEAPDSLSGAIIGINHDRPAAATYWNTEASIKDTYYLAGCSSSTLPPAGLELTASQLGQLDLGSAWIKGDDFSFPILAVHASHDNLMLHAAAIHFSNGESAVKITRSFNVGCPAGVVWTSSSDALRPDGNRIHVTNDAYSGNVTLTASCGSLRMEYPIYIDKPVGIDVIQTGVPVSVRYYTAGGLEVAADALVPGIVYVAVRKYADGKITTSRFVSGRQ